VVSSSFDYGKNKDSSTATRKPSVPIKTAKMEAAAAGSKHRIALSEKEFDKY
jgi:hypothetical protein